MDLDQYLFGTWITAPDLSSNVEDGDINGLASAVQELEIREHEAHRLILNHQDVIPKLQELVNCGLDRFNYLQDGCSGSDDRRRHPRADPRIDG